MPESVPQPQVATISKPHDWKKVGLTVLIIVMVAGLIVVAYWFLVLNKSSEDSNLTGPVPKVTPKTSSESAKEATESAEKYETSALKTYEFEYDGKSFSFKYPSGWVVEKKEIDPSANFVDYEVAKGQNTVTFKSKRAYGYGDGDASDETHREVTVRFEGDEVKSNEITGNYYDIAYLVAPQDLTSDYTFFFEITSGKPNVTSKEKTEMFDIVKSFNSE